MSQLTSDLQEVFRNVFDDGQLAISESTSAADIDGWDSMAHMNLIIAIEERFGVKFTVSELAALGGRGQTVNNLLQLIRAKTGRTDA
jgi:acyl carrier protein